MLPYPKKPVLSPYIRNEACFPTITQHKLARVTLWNYHAALHFSRYCPRHSLSQTPGLGPWGRSSFKVNLCIPFLRNQSACKWKPRYHRAFLRGFRHTSTTHTRLAGRGTGTPIPLPTCTAEVCLQTGHSRTVSVRISCSGYITGVE